MAGATVMKTTESEFYSKLGFEKISTKHKKTLMNWFEKDYIKEYFYGQGLINTINNINLFCEGVNTNGRYTFDHWVATHNSTPFAFLMTTPVSGPYNENSDYDKWYVDGKDTFTLDILIGEEQFLGKGLADTLIKKFILEKYANADFFIIDPEISNTRAIRVYEKVGFREVCRFTPDYNPKPHVMMRICVDGIKKP